MEELRLTVEQIMQSICSRVALEYRLLHILVAGDGKPVTASELASESGADELLISA